MTFEALSTPRTWGFLRETADLARAAGLDADTGLRRDGLEDYLSVIFPDVDDWVHDKATGLKTRDGKVSRARPDYRSDQLRLIVEFDGTQHYQSPIRIQTDRDRQVFYEEHGYKVVRIPYFIQLTNEVVRTVFSVTFEGELFDGSVPSIGPKGKNTPAFLCPAGIKRMAREFALFPEQYEVNLNALQACPDYELTEWKLLVDAYA